MNLVNQEATLEKFGVDTTNTPRSHWGKVVVSCSACGCDRVMSAKSYINSLKKESFCKKCPEYSRARSEIAAKSNKSRKIGHEKYLPYIDAIAAGKPLLEVARELGVDDSTVSKFFWKHYNLRSKFGNKSLQEDFVFNELQAIFPKIVRGIRYSDKTRHRADFWVPELDKFVEYDGSGFYHQLKQSDESIDQEFSPIRLNAQAYHGGGEYIRWRLGLPTTGYASVKTPKEYAVKQLEKISPANEMLESCHPLGSTAGKHVFGLYYKNKLIGVAKFGSPTNPSDIGALELRRFFILDGTPRNTESWFLDKCMKRLDFKGKVVTYVHPHEKGSYLKALGWTRLPTLAKTYDFYLIDGKVYNKRIIWGWAKKIGLVDRLGTTDAKATLAAALGGKKIEMGSKIKFEVYIAS